jgi:uncharacterized protein YecT (DUF1311 family)
MPDKLPGDPLAGPTYKGFAATPLRKPPEPRRSRRFRPSRMVAVAGVAGLALIISLIALQPPSAMRTASAEKPPGAGRWPATPAPAPPSPPSPFLATAPAPAAAPLQAEAALAAPEPPPPPPEPARRHAPAAPPPAAKPVVAALAADKCSRRDGIAQLACRDPQIASLEREVNAAFAAAMRETDAPGDLARDQESWIVRRDRTAREAPDTVADLYRERIATLQSHAASSHEEEAVVSP